MSSIPWPAREEPWENHRAVGNPCLLETGQHADRAALDSALSPGAGIEPHEAERSRRRSIDDLANVHVEVAAHHRQLVDQPMLTARNAFSSSFTISATFVMSTTVSMSSAWGDRGACSIDTSGVLDERVVYESQDVLARRVPELVAPRPIVAGFAVAKLTLDLQRHPPVGHTCSAQRTVTGGPGSASPARSWRNDPPPQPRPTHVSATTRDTERASRLMSRGSSR